MKIEEMLKADKEFRKTAELMAYEGWEGCASYTEDEYFQSVVQCAERLLKNVLCCVALDNGEAE